MIFSLADIEQMEHRYRGTFINSISGFKSLQMVSTINKQGTTNIALFNSIFHVGANPPLIGMVVRPDGPERGTLKNIEETGVYTLNNVLEVYVKEAHQTSARYPDGESEFEKCGFNASFIDGFAAPFIEQATVKIGLSLQEKIPVKINGTTIIIGKVSYLQLPDDCLKKDGFADLEKAGSITVNGLDSYHQTKVITRLSYAKPNKEAVIIDDI